MVLTSKEKQVWEFGDFQTPDELATQIMAVLIRLGIYPLSVLEPTCGKGSLFISAMKAYRNSEKFIGVDINRDYLDHLRQRIVAEGLDANAEVIQADFFQADWSKLLGRLPEPILVVGNPPWVTSADLGVLQSSNLPDKSNFYKRKGLDAKTGKSNFDISEWMLLQILAWLEGKNGIVAMLCKTTVARKILAHIWKQKLSVSSAQIFKIDAKRYFAASVEACLFVVQLKKDAACCKCEVFDCLSDLSPATIIGYQDNYVISDITTYQRLHDLAGTDQHYVWRSGIKHDCSKVMELTRIGNYFVNGKAVAVTLEADFVYPLLKSSDIGNNRPHNNKKYMLVPQRYTGEDTNKIKLIAPQTWIYLQENQEAFNKRGSSIYRGRPSFSIFGVGDYTFAPWKVAISGFYKRLNFVVVGPLDGQPVVFDDTVYFLACATQQEAEFIANLLRSKSANDFLNSLIFWEDKRPITVESLKRLDLYSLARSLGYESEYFEITRAKGMPNYTVQMTQLRLLESLEPYD